jgi:hypothetical protein
MEGIKLIDIVFLVVTGAIAYHGITFRDENGNRTTVHLLFGCIALIFFLRVLFVDILEVVSF